MYIKKTKREKFDKCNICLETKELSWDHIPPQGCLNYEQVEISSFFDKLLGKTTTNKPFISQNGLKYRTICNDCNSFMGSHYDDELNKLVETVLKHVNSSLIMPMNIRVKVRPLPIIKSIVGHILAAKKQLDDVKYDNIYRAFVLDEKLSIPKELNLFYWIYPFENVIIMRDFLMPAKREGDFGNCVFFQLLKFFPLAFLISETDNYQGLPSLTALAKNSTIETEIEIPLYFDREYDNLWPEKIDNNNIIFGSHETVNSVHVVKKNSRRL